MTAERLQKVLARAGLGSRRELEQWITAGRVSVNGQIVGVGTTVKEGDVVRVDGRLVPAGRLFARKLRVIGFHKPVGLVCTRKDEQGRPTVYEALPRVAGGRWLSIGRLDLTTSGLLLFTTEGELAHRLMHPSTGVEREYAVRVLGTVTPAMIERLKGGVLLDDGEARFDDVVDAGGSGANHWYHVILREGRNREVRRLWDAVGVTVSRLIRVRYGPIALPREQRGGHWWELSPVEVNQLLVIAGLAPTDGATVDQSVRRRDRVPRSGRPQGKLGKRSSADAAKSPRSTDMAKRKPARTARAADRKPRRPH
jgi:23S rRNA pseudouridine2605 synthase